MTPEDQLMYAITHLEETNQVIDDYKGKGSISYQVGAFFPASGGVPNAYWSRDSYLGFGAGAHSFWNDNGLGVRWCNAEDPKQYREAIASGSIPQRERETLTLEQAVSESFFLGLRVLTGLDLARLEALYGKAALAPHLAEVARLAASGALVREGDLVRLAPGAVILANGVFERFL